jgi:hypothetical protein
MKFRLKFDFPIRYSCRRSSPRSAFFEDRGHSSDLQSSRNMAFPFAAIAEVTVRTIRTVRSCRVAR